MTLQLAHVTHALIYHHAQANEIVAGFKRQDMLAEYRPHGECILCIIGDESYHF